MSYLSVKEVFPIEAHAAHTAAPLSIATGSVDGIKYCAVQNGAAVSAHIYSYTYIYLPALPCTINYLYIIIIMIMI